MKKLVITTQDELEQIVQASVKKALKEQVHFAGQEQERWFNIKQAAKFLGLAEQTIYQKVSGRDIPVHKKGGKIWFLKRELEEWLKEGRQKTRQEIQRDIKEGRI